MLSNLFICSYQKDPTTPRYIYLYFCCITSSYTDKTSIDSTEQFNHEGINPKITWPPLKKPPKKPSKMHPCKGTKHSKCCLTVCKKCSNSVFSYTYISLWTAMSTIMRIIHFFKHKTSHCTHFCQVFSVEGLQIK